MPVAEISSQWSHDRGRRQLSCAWPTTPGIMCAGTLLTSTSVLADKLRTFDLMESCPDGVQRSPAAHGSARVGTMRLGAPGESRLTAGGLEEDLPSSNVHLPGTLSPRSVTTLAPRHTGDRGFAPRLIPCEPLAVAPGGPRLGCRSGDVTDGDQVVGDGVEHPVLVDPEAHDPAAPQRARQHCSRRQRRSLAGLSPVTVPPARPRGGATGRSRPPLPDPDSADVSSEAARLAPRLDATSPPTWGGVLGRQRRSREGCSREGNETTCDRRLPERARHTLLAQGPVIVG